MRFKLDALVAQLVERGAYTSVAPGSSPGERIIHNLVGKLTDFFVGGGLRRLSFCFLSFCAIFLL